MAVDRKLLLIGTDFPPNHGGISSYTLELGRALSKLCSVVILAPGAARMKGFDQSLPFKVIRTPAIPILRLLAFFIYIPWLLKSKAFDAVLHTVWPTAIISHLYHGLFAVPYFVSIHGSEIFDDKRTWRRTLKSWAGRWRKAALRKADAVFPVSRYTAKRICHLDLDPDKIHIISCGVNPQKFKPVTKEIRNQGPKILLTVARLDKHKGHDRIMEALAKLKRQGILLKYLIAGRGAEENRLKQFAVSLGIQNQIQFLGFVPEDRLPALYADADIFIMASRELPGRLDLIEGFGISFLEASASGLPVIAGNSGGVSDAVRDQQTGILVDPNDSDEIADAIRRLIEDGPLAKRLGLEGRRWAANEMSWHNMAERIYQYMLA